MFEYVPEGPAMDPAVFRRVEVSDTEVEYDAPTVVETLAEESEVASLVPDVPPVTEYVTGY